MTPKQVNQTIQGSFEDLLAAQPLHGVTFVVVDLETTGGSSTEDAITEIGAVKIRGGQVLGEFATLVNPGKTIPPFITRLTGISDQMVADAPSITSVLPAFLEFAHGTVLVAHNAPFDIGFLRAACEHHDFAWPQFEVIDTVVLARRTISRGEVPNYKLATLAALFRAETKPSHRALDDARATVDVLHGLLARLGSYGVQSLAELTALPRQVSEAQRRKRHLADGLPTGPGVYIFRASDGRPLYIGTSRNIRTRVRNYFAASETRERMAEMVALAEQVEAVSCAHALEAQIRELRLIGTLKPPYNRRSKYPERAWWITLTDEHYPRLSLVRELRSDRRFLGPFTSRRAAENAATAIHEVLPLRQCKKRLSVRIPTSSCVLAELGKCGAPCLHRQTPEEYDRHVADFVHSIEVDPSALLEKLQTRIGSLAAQQRYEDAAVLRDRLLALLRALIRMHRVGGLGKVAELIAAGPDGTGAWEIVMIRYGRLVGADVAPDVHSVLSYVERLHKLAENVPASTIPFAQASVEETERILAWLDRPGIRVISVDGTWSCVATGPEKWGGLARILNEVRADNWAASHFS